MVWGAAAALLMAASPVWAALKIGYVNYAQLLSESPQAKRISAQLRAEFEPREQAIVKLQNSIKAKASAFQRDSATMTDDQRSRMQNEISDSDRDLQRRQQELQDDLNARRNEALSRLQRTLVATVRDYAKAQNFDLVLADGVIYWTPALDITPAILSKLQTTEKPAGGSAASRARRH